jgi:hypothetical protein
MKLLKLNLISSGIWSVPGTGICLCRWESPDWVIETWDVAEGAWLKRHGLLDATDRTRAGLLRALSVADAVDPLPRDDDEYAHIKLIRRPDGSYTEPTATFSLTRETGRTGRTYWRLEHERQDLPGGNWATTERTLRTIRERIDGFYRCLAEQAGEGPYAQAAGRGDVAPTSTSMGRAMALIG